MEWHNPQSDVRAVLPWCDLSDDERGLRGVHWERGSFEELVGVVGAAMKLLPIWDEVEYRDEKIILALAWDEEGQRLENHSPHLHNAGSSWKQWKKLHQRIEERNWGIYTAEGNRGDWKFDWIKYESPRSGYRCVAHWLEIHEPTQHERIEASLVLREWLAKNAPDLMMEWFAV
ncbi:hypothetical protein EON83_06415 [bacterium]|nr:MAG: hypothetical protein EON83_06415 [bacterium]